MSLARLCSEFQDIGVSPTSSRPMPKPYPNLGWVLEHWVLEHWVLMMINRPSPTLPPHSQLRLRPWLVLKMRTSIHFLVSVCVGGDGIKPGDESTQSAA